MTFDGLQVALLMMYAALGWLAVRQMRTCEWRAEPIAWVLLAVHGMVFYVALLIDIQDQVVNAQVWNTWSQALRLHSLITIVTIEFFRWQRMRVKHGC